MASKQGHTMNFSLLHIIKQPTKFTFIYCYSQATVVCYKTENVDIPGEGSVCDVVHQEQVMLLDTTQFSHKIPKNGISGKNSSCKQ
jgi:hypothetical protein